MHRYLAILVLISSTVLGQTTGDYSLLKWNGTKFVGELRQTFPPATHNQAWSTITSTPTTLSGYGITDALTSSSSLSADNISSGSLALARIAQGGATSGQALSWNGTAWAPATISSSGATLGANTFTASQTLSAGNLIIPDASASPDSGSSMTNGQAAIRFSGQTILFGNSLSYPNSRMVMMTNEGITIGPGSSIRFTESNAYNTSSTLRLFSDGTITNNIARYGVDSATPATLTQRPARASGTNIAGSVHTIEGGLSTGNKKGGSVKISTAGAGSSGSAQNAATTRIEVTGDGYIIFNSLPTSASGLATGTLWNNSGVLSVAP